MKRPEGFTLVELVSIIVILAIISITVMGVSNSGDAQRVQASRDQVLLALRSARHLAMAKAGAGRSIEFVALASNDSIDVQDAGSSVSLGAANYPYVLGQGIEISDATFRFDKMGRTTAGSISISASDASVTVSVSANGASQ
ncbi:hypothetical protein [uncultured Pseudoteredinibacter sp.]|uniref:hypothetical protein n=1 Tax=uncultured Pseudoteredinibacter sp. TaxID=1641701 RepID=UPI002628738B|nr:hypothetical protein [uncultured Pseudoteredinibacter sp.]